MVPSDSLVSVSYINKLSKTPCDCLSLLESFWISCDAFDFWACKWIDRNRNSYAHIVAQFMSLLNSIFWRKRLFPRVYNEVVILLIKIINLSYFASLR